MDFITQSRNAKNNLREVLTQRRKGNIYERKIELPADVLLSTIDDELRRELS